MTRYYVCGYRQGNPDCRIHIGTKCQRKPGNRTMFWDGPYTSLQAAENAMSAIDLAGKYCGNCHPER